MSTLLTRKADGIAWWPTARVEKYNANTVRDIAEHLNITPEDVGYQALEHMKAYESLSPDSIVEIEGNEIVNTGKTRIADLIIGTGQAFTGGGTPRAMMGVGNSSTAVAGGQTALLGTAYYKGLSSGPSNSSGTITAAANFASGEAEFAWNEWCWAIATATPVASSNFNTATTTGIMLNRKVASLGTKGSSSSWTLTTTIQIQGAP